MSTPDYKHLHSVFVPGRNITRQDRFFLRISHSKAHTSVEIRLTDRAHAKIQEIAAIERLDLSDSLLRVAVIPGGCSGLTYELGWDTTEQEGDRVLEVDGIRVVTDRRSAPYIDGTELDFTDGLEGKGFHFMNPQAARTCACGESFGV